MSAKIEAVIAIGIGVAVYFMLGVTACLVWGIISVMLIAVDADIQKKRLRTK